MPAIKVVLPFDEENLLVNTPGPNPRPQAQVQALPARAIFQGLETPAGVGCFAMRRMLLAAKGCVVATERQAKEIAAQDLKDWRQRWIKFFVRPGRHRVRADFTVIALESDRPQMPAPLCDESFNLLRGQPP